MRININIVKHLEYLGYEIFIENNFIIIDKSDHKQLRIRDGENFLYFNSDYIFNPNTCEDEGGWLKFVNMLNAESKISTFFKTDNRLNIFAAYFGTYDKTAFRLFFEGFEFDCNSFILSQDESDHYLGVGMHLKDGSIIGGQRYDA